MELLTLPPDVLKTIFYDIPPPEIPNLSYVNKQLYTELTSEGFWKETCLHRYYSSTNINKPAAESWKQHALVLDKSTRWSECHALLMMSNKGYTLTHVGQPTASGAPTLALGVGNKPFVEGPFTGRYFEVVIDALPGAPEETQIVIGLAPFNIMDNPAWSKVYGYTNVGRAGVWQGSPFGKPYGVGDRIGVLLNTEYMTVSFLKNDMLQGTPFVRLDKTIPWHPTVGLLYNGAQVTIPLPPLREPPKMPVG